MKKISFIQTNVQQGPTENNSFCIPYTVGSLWSYAKKDFIIDSNYELDQIIWYREDIDVLVSKLKNNDIVAFSHYIWNKNYNISLAKKLKKKNKNIIIIFGGPEVPIVKKSLFREYPFINIVVKKEGEVIFSEILKTLICNKNIKNVKGLLINDNKKIIDTGDGDRINDLKDLPSPYLDGVFNSIIKNNPDVEWSGTLETNRGCPYKCTFCDWGSLTLSKIKKFNLEKIFKEIEFMGKHKFGHVHITDANFGIFKERDNLIVDKIIETKNKYNFPTNLSITMAKHQQGHVIDMTKKLINANIVGQALGLSVQSLDEQVLKNIKRSNLEINNIENIFNLCNQKNIPIWTELILGLPGETLSSFKKGYYKLLTAGNHSGITVHITQILPNTELNLDQMHEFEIKTIEALLPSNNKDDKFAETIRIVNQTKDMPLFDIVECYSFLFFINMFHSNNITTYISRFLNVSYNISFDEFYDNLYSYVKNNDWYNQAENEYKNLIQHWLTIDKFFLKWKYHNIFSCNMNNIYLAGIYYCLIENKMNDMHSLVSSFLNKKFNLNKKLHRELLDFQFSSAINYDNISHYPIKKSYNYDFYNKILFNKKLDKKVNYKFIASDNNKNIKFKTFLEKIYFKRRENYTRTKILNE